MKVKEVIKTSAELLGLKNIVSNIDGVKDADDEETKNEVNNMLLAVNLACSSIAGCYIDLVEFKSVTPKSHEIQYSQISSNVIKEILGVYNHAGNKVQFSKTLTGIRLGNVDTVLVEFSYFPSKVGIDDSIDYFLGVSDMVLAMGVVGEYLYIKGELNDASVWDKRFKNAMFNAIRPKRNISIKARRWLE